MSCPICECDQLRDFSLKDDRRLMICVECRHISWRDMPTDAQLADYYAREYTSGHNQFDIQTAAKEYYVSHVQELAGLAGKDASGLSIADLGCSYPIFLECAKQAGCHTLGVDWSAEVREYGRSVGIDVLTPPQFLDTIRPRCVDVLRYAHMLEHMIDPVETLRQHLAKLKPGGLVYITQPNFPVFKPESCAIELKDSVWPGHLHFFNPISLGAMLDRLNIKMTKFVSLTDEAVAEITYRQAIDVIYAARRLETLAPLGDLSWGPLNNYPYYTGQNVLACGVFEP